ncbi:hypothetical protein [Actinoalloteichus spitiensis]|uniref:hypothetical protein n=1 Tax=Actinoalloteichus spitiensis TaxID=252394 RepID=UPI00036FAB07|nr:hypothetical protein [Actinoalloteichus spitiensis]
MTPTAFLRRARNSFELIVVRRALVPTTTSAGASRVLRGCGRSPPFRHPTARPALFDAVHGPPSALSPLLRVLDTSGDQRPPRRRCRTGPSGPLGTAPSSSFGVLTTENGPDLAEAVRGQPLTRTLLVRSIAPSPFAVLNLLIAVLVSAVGT